VLSLDHSPKGSQWLSVFHTGRVVWAVEVAHAAHGKGRGFGISYLGARIILLILLARAFFHVREARFFNKVYLIGFGTGAGVWALSLLLPEDVSGCCGH